MSDIPASIEEEYLREPRLILSDDAVACLYCMGKKPMREMVTDRNGNSFCDHEERADYYVGKIENIEYIAGLLMDAIQKKAHESEIAVHVLALREELETT